MSITIERTKVTVQDLNQMSRAQLVELYNEITGENLKTFRDKETAVRRVQEALDRTRDTEVQVEREVDSTPMKAKKKATAKKATAAPDEKVVVQKGRKTKLMKFKASKEIKSHRPGTKRAQIIAMLNTEKGATLEEVMEKIGWDRKTAYEGIKLLHSYLGYGLEQETENGKIRLTT